MAVGGVNDNNYNIEIKTALAALEIRNFMSTEILTKKALGQDFLGYKNRNSLWRFDSRSYWII